MEILTASTKPQRRILVVVDSDPRINPRVAEAVRMAGGVGVWDQVSVHVVLRGPATRALGEQAASLPEARMFKQFIGMIRENGGQVSVMPDAESMEDIRPEELLENGMKPEAFAALTAECASVLRF